MNTIEEIAAKIWGFPVHRIFESTRKREICEGRMVVVAFTNRILGESQLESANKYGLKRHNSTSHACQTVDNLVCSNKSFKEKYDEFLNEANLLITNKLILILTVIMLSSCATPKPYYKRKKNNRPFYSKSERGNDLYYYNSRTRTYYFKW